MSDTIAAVNCTVEIYPFEGGPYTLLGGQIKSCTVDKTITGARAGAFEITLAPGGPTSSSGSAEGVPTWSQVITPMSFVLIGMQRGRRAAITMIGVVTQVVEVQDWHSDDQQSTAQRETVIRGEDFTFYFNNFSWYAMTLFGLVAGTPFGINSGVPANVGLPALISQGTLTGNPGQIAQTWYSTIMAGASGIMSKTFVPYPAGASGRVLFADVLTASWEMFPNVYIPFGDWYLSSEGSWTAKFQSILTAPYYEFFVATAPSGAYIPSGSATVNQRPAALGECPAPTGSALVTAGKQFTMQSMPSAPAAGPVVVARVNPVPAVACSVSGPGVAGVFGAIDASRWTALPLFQPDDYGFTNSAVAFGVGETRNFYILNPTWYRNAFGDSNNNTSSFMYLYTGAGDGASIHRYGYRPEIGTTRWFSDLPGTAAQNPELNIPQTVATLLGRLASWFEPTPLMARASNTGPLRPDILPGCRYRYNPYKGQPTWDFYVDGVKHDFRFGGQSRTTLTLSRGLPTTIYDDTSTNGVLRQMHLGNAQRVNGVYKTGLPTGSSPGLQTFAAPGDVTSMLADIARIYVSPQFMDQ